MRQPRLAGETRIFNIKFYPVALTVPPHVGTAERLEMFRQRPVTASSPQGVYRTSVPTSTLRSDKIWAYRAGLGRGGQAAVKVWQPINRPETPSSRSGPLQHGELMTERETAAVRARGTRVEIEFSACSVAELVENATPASLLSFL